MSNSAHSCQDAIHGRRSSAKRLRIEHVWQGVPTALVVWVRFCMPLGLLDFWWHLKLGQIITETGAIPRTDLFSFTAAGAYSSPHSWLAETIFYLIYRVGDFPLLIALNAVLLAAALGVIQWWCFQETRSHRLAALAASGPALVLAALGNLRPQTFSLLLFPIFYRLLDGYARGGPNRLWALPPLMVLWVNLHGGFVLGLALTAFYLGCEIIGYWSADASQRPALRPRIRYLAATLACSTLASLLNPEGYQIYDLVKLIYDHATSRAFVILEFEPPRIDSFEGWAVFYAGFCFSLVVLSAAGRRLSLMESGLFFATAVAGMWAFRFGAWFAFAAAPLLARSLAVLARRKESAVASPAGFARSEDSPAVAADGVLPSLVAALMVAITVFLSPWIYGRLRGIPSEENTWAEDAPQAAVEYLKQHSPPGNIFHPQSYGDYLIWSLWPQKRTFIDGRVHLFSDELIKNYFDILSTSDFALLDRYDIRLLLLSKQQPDNQRLRQAAEDSVLWRRIYEDRSSILFQRSTPTEESKCLGIP